MLTSAGPDLVAHRHEPWREAFSGYLGRITDALIASTTDEFLQRVLPVFVDAIRADVAVVRLYEDKRLRSRVAIGLEEEVAARFSLSITESFAGVTPAPGRPLISSIPREAPARGDWIRKEGVLTLHALELSGGRGLLGVVYLGMLVERDLTDEERRLLTALAAPTTTILTRYLAHETLEQAVRSRDEILSVVAHDLRNPINAISIAANTLLPRLPDMSARRVVDRILRGARRADRIVEDLLEIHAIETGRFSIETRSVDTAEFILAALESQHGLAAEASVIVASDLSPELPPLQADAERLLEVLENLISNALKFTGPSGKVTVGAGPQGPDVLVWVKDSGSGISADDLPHVFDRFWQAKKKERRGTGLGLTICKGIVEAHGGRIWAESSVGVGTTLFFTIPSAAPPLSVPEAPVVANILLVDDRPENLLSLRAILDRPDYRVMTARSGAEALALVLRERFDVALIDVAMPGMNGLEVAAHLKELERSRDIPIIFVTAFGNDPEEIHRAYSAGGADYLIKPLDTEIVRKKVAVFVDLSRRRQGNGQS